MTELHGYSVLEQNVSFVVNQGHQQGNFSTVGNEGLAPRRVAEAREEKVPSSGESSPVRPTLAQSIVFGRSGVEETNNW
ncbi:unnamed protein product, partial [Sphacelaria rigidula]